MTWGAHGGISKIFFTIVFRSKVLFFVAYSILTGQTKVEFDIYWVLRITLQLKQLSLGTLLLNYLGRLCDFEANLGDICKICDKDGRFFATHSIISSSFVRLLRCSSIQKSNQGITEMTRPKGAFYNYVDQILPNIHHLPIPC